MRCPYGKGCPVTKIQLPRRYRRPYHVKRDGRGRTLLEGVTFWMEANSKAHAKRMAKALADDMKSSAKLRRAWEIVPGHVGVGYSGIRKARQCTGPWPGREDRS